MTSDFVPFVGEPRECRGDVAFPPSFGPQPSGAIEEPGTIHALLRGPSSWDLPLGPRDISRCFDLFEMGMDLLVPEVKFLILKLRAMMVLIKAGFMSLCHLLEERMAL